MTEYKIALGPVRYPDEFEKSMNAKREQIEAEKKEIKSSSFYCDGGYMFCIFELGDKVVRPSRRTKAKTGEASAS
jgi:hypothetical protein